MSFIGSSYDEGEIVIPTVSETDHRLVQDLYNKVKGTKQMKTCKNCIYSRKIIPKNTNCPSEFVCSLSDEDFHDCISDDMSHYKLSISNGKEFERPQGDLKSSEALKAYARKVLCGNNPTNSLLIRMFDEIIDNAPTFPQYQPDEYKCPECGYESTHEYRYCPDCGKKLVDDNYRRYPGWDKVENMRKSQKGEDK